MKEDRFLNIPGEIPILTNDETNRLKGGFKKIKTNPSVRMDSGDNNENCHGHSGGMAVVKVKILTSIANSHANAIID